MRTIEEQVSSLLSRRVAEERDSGAQRPDIEALALFESISLNFYLRPRAVLYAYHLARNGLKKVVDAELAAISELSSVVQDLGKKDPLIRGTAALERARVALIQAGDVGRNPHAITKFDSAIGEFLKKGLRSKNTAGMPRTGSEARGELPSLYEELKERHDELLDRLFSLAVSLENFISAPYEAVLGMTTANRVRSEIESVLAEAKAGDISTWSPRDAAVRLISARAAMKVLTDRPDLYAPKLSQASGTPAGYKLSGATDPTPVSILGDAGPFVLPDGAQVSMETRTMGSSPESIPHPNLNNRAAIASTYYTATTVPSGYFLFLRLSSPSGSETVRIPVAGTADVDAVCGSISSVLGSRGRAEDFLDGRILIYVNSPYDSVTVVDSCSETDPLTLTPRTFTNSAHAALGFFIGQSGTAGATDVGLVADSLRYHFGHMVEVEQEGSAIRLRGLDTTPGAFLEVSAPDVLGLDGYHVAWSNSVRLYGEVFGEKSDEVDPAGIVEVGDILLSATSGGVDIIGTANHRIQLSTEIPTFDGYVSVDSGVLKAIGGLDAKLQQFVEELLKSPYHDGLGKIDSAMAALIGDSASAQRGEVLSLLEDLRQNVYHLAELLSADATLIKTGAAVEERKIVEGAISSFEERKYDRAVSLLLKGRVHELLQLDNDTASFGGSLMRAMSDVAQSDLLYPNRALEEDTDLRGRVTR